MSIFWIGTYTIETDWTFTKISERMRRTTISESAETIVVVSQINAFYAALARRTIWHRRLRYNGDKSIDYSINVNPSETGNYLVDFFVQIG